MDFVLCHGLRWSPSSSLKALFHEQLWRADGYYCAVHIEVGSPLEYSSDAYHARLLLLLAKGWTEAQASKLDVISIALPWFQRRQFGEDVRVQTASGKPPNTIFFHISALCTFWKARNSGPKAFDGGYRRCTKGLIGACHSTAWQLHDTRGIAAHAGFCAWRATQKSPPR